MWRVNQINDTLQMKGLKMRRLESSDLEAMRLPRRFWQSNFESIPNGSNKQAVARYLTSIREMRREGAGLLLWGSNGSGKTSIGSLIIKVARSHGFSALFINSASIKSIVVSKEMYDTESGLTLWKRAQTVDFLLLDDLGKGSQDSQGFGERLIDDLIRSRYAEKRCTLITTNILKRDLLEFIKPSTLHILKGSSAQLKVDSHDFRVSEGEAIRIMINGGDQ